MLPTDKLIQKATTTTTTLAATIPHVWSSTLERNLRKRAVFEQSVIVNTDLTVPKAGDEVFIPILPDLGQADLLTEGTDMTVYSLTTATSVPLTPVEYGKVVEITRKALDRINYDGMAAIVDRLAYSMSQRVESNIAALFNATVPGTSNAMAVEYANGKSSSTIAATDVFTNKLLLQGIADLETNNNVPFDDNYYRLYLSPKQWMALLEDADTRQDLRFAAPERLLNGEVGILHGCRLIVTNYIPTTAEGSGGAVTVFNAMLLAPRWAAIAYKRRPQVYVDPTLYDGGRRRRFGVTADFDVELLHNDRGIVLKSA
jgi:N4-gp56 family major capsid protein